METRLYQLQTKLYHVEDTLVSFGPLQLTLRQCFVLVLGGCGSLNCWRFLNGLGITELILSSVPLLLSALIAGVRVADRYAEAWLLVVLEYHRSARVSLWRPWRDAKMTIQHQREDEDNA